MIPLNNVFKERKEKEREDFARRLTEVRSRLRLNQEEFAAAIGYTDGFISLLEGCKTRPGYKFFKNIIDRFKVNPVYLLTGRGNMFLDDDTEVKIKGYEGPDKEMVAKLVGYIEQVPTFRFAVFEFFLTYLYKNEDIVEVQKKEYFAEKKKKNRSSGEHKK
jgi:transcriptional regulator with XRE-family HTH domain